MSETTNGQVASDFAAQFADMAKPGRWWSDEGLAEHDRQIAEQTWDACVASMDAAYSDDDIPWPSVNPYRKQEPSHVQQGGE
jgi:hypothetical protein